MKEIICPHCKSSHTEEHLSTKDFFLSQDLFSIYSCHSCRVLFTYPFPEPDVLYARYYKSENYLSHNKKASGLFSIAYRSVQKINIRMKRRMVERLIHSGERKILEVGAGTGDFLASCKKHKWKCYGVEPSEKAREAALEFNSLPLSSSLDEIKDRDFSVITLWHVLEHIPDLNETINRLKSMLAENGHLVIAVPNHKSFDAKHYQQYWAGYDVPRHLYHFNKNSLASIIQKNELELIKIRPMLFDSFYVSLLSEKYRRSNFIVSVLTGLFLGVISNLSGWFSGEYSSLIFIFRGKKLKGNS